MGASVNNASWISLVITNPTPMGIVEIESSYLEPVLPEIGDSVLVVGSDVDEEMMGQTGILNNIDEIDAVVTISSVGLQFFEMKELCKYVMPTSTVATPVVPVVLVEPATTSSLSTSMSIEGDEEEDEEDEEDEEEELREFVVYVDRTVYTSYTVHARNEEEALENYLEGDYEHLDECEEPNGCVDDNGPV